MRYPDELLMSETEVEEPSVEPCRIQVFCLPHAGGNSLHYQAWQRWLPPGAEVVPIDLPGHGTRLREPLIGEWRPLVEDLVNVVGEQVDAPFVVVGHSLGALLAYEVGRALGERGTPPELVVAAGRNGPSAGLAHRPIHDLPDAQFLSALRRLGGTPEGVLHRPELLGMYLPVLRTDLRLAELYAREPGPCLPCPVIVFAGRGDRMTDAVGMLAWQRETTGTFELVLVEGDHFFLEEPEFTEALRARIARLPVRDPRRAAPRAEAPASR